MNSNETAWRGLTKSGVLLIRTNVQHADRRWKTPIKMPEVIATYDMGYTVHKHRGWDYYRVPKIFEYMLFCVCNYELIS